MAARLVPRTPPGIVPVVRPGARGPRPSPHRLQVPWCTVVPAGFGGGGAAGATPPPCAVVPACRRGPRCTYALRTSGPPLALGALRPPPDRDQPSWAPPSCPRLPVVVPRDACPPPSRSCAWPRLPAALPHPVAPARPGTGATRSRSALPRPGRCCRLDALAPAPSRRPRYSHCAPTECGAPDPGLPHPNDSLRLAAVGPPGPARGLPATVALEPQWRPLRGRLRSPREGPSAGRLSPPGRIVARRPPRPALPASMIAPSRPPARFHRRSGARCAPTRRPRARAGSPGCSDVARSHGPAPAASLHSNAEARAGRQRAARPRPRTVGTAMTNGPASCALTGPDRARQHGQASV